MTFSIKHLNLNEEVYVYEKNVSYSLKYVYSTELIEIISAYFEIFLLQGLDLFYRLNFFFIECILVKERESFSFHHETFCISHKTMKICCSLTIGKDSIMQKVQRSVDSHLEKQDRMSPSNTDSSVCDKAEINSVFQRRDSFSSCSSDSAVYCSSRHMKIQGSVPDVSNQLKSCNSFQDNVASDVRRERHSSDSSVISIASNTSSKEHHESSATTNTSKCSQSPPDSFEYGSSDDLKSAKLTENKLTPQTATSYTRSSSSKTIIHQNPDALSHKSESKQSPPQIARYHHDLRKNIRRKACCHGDCNETHTTLIVRRYTETASHQHSQLHTVAKQNTSSSSASGSSVESSPNSNKKRKSELDKLYESLHEIKWAKHFSPENILKQNEARRISSSKSPSFTDTTVRSANTFSPSIKEEKSKGVRKRTFSESNEVENSASIVRKFEICKKIDTEDSKIMNENHISSIQDPPKQESLLSNAVYLNNNNNNNNVPSANHLDEKNLSTRKSSNHCNHTSSIKSNVGQMTEHTETSKAEINIHKVLVHCTPDESHKKISNLLKTPERVYIPINVTNIVKLPNKNHIIHAKHLVTASVKSNSLLKSNLQTCKKNDVQLNISNVQCKSLQLSSGSCHKINISRISSPHNPNIVQLQTCNSSDVEREEQTHALNETTCLEKISAATSVCDNIPSSNPNTSHVVPMQVNIKENNCLKELNTDDNAFVEKVEECSQPKETLDLPLLSSECISTKSKFISEMPPILEPCVDLLEQKHEGQHNLLSASNDFFQRSVDPSIQVPESPYCEESKEKNCVAPCIPKVNIKEFKHFCPQEADIELSSGEEIEVIDSNEPSEESDCIMSESENTCTGQFQNKAAIPRRHFSNIGRIGRLILKKYIRSINRMALLKAKYEKNICETEEKCGSMKTDQESDSDEGNQSFDYLDDEISIIETVHKPVNTVCKSQNDNYVIDNRTTFSEHAFEQEQHVVKKTVQSSDESVTRFRFGPESHTSSNKIFIHCSPEEKTHSSNSSDASDTDSKATQYPVVKHRPYIHGLKKSAVEDNQLTIFPTDEPSPDEDETVSEEEMDSPEEVVRLRLLYGFTLHYKGITVNKNDSYTQVILKMSSKNNIFLSIEALTELKDTLNNAENDSNCQVVIVSGIGNCFCSGLDLKPLIGNRRNESAKQMAVAVKEFIEALASFHKPLVAVVNGSAIGLGVTLLTYCDVVLASNTATFRMPYSQLGYMPEGAVTLTLPQVVGSTVAMDMLLRGRKITARQALNFGLVSEVLEANKLPHQLVSRVRTLAENPVSSMESTKSMLRWHLYGKLHVALENEVEMLPKQWLSPTCQGTLKHAFDNGLLGD